MEDHSYPLFNIHAWVSAGSASDPVGAAGCAHMIEHLAFCGTIDNPRSPMSLFNRLGGVVGAFTLKEYTLYSVTVPAEHAIRALNAVLDIVFNPALEENEFTREKHVVMNEAAQGDLNPESCNINHIWQKAFPDSPYGRPVIGYPGDIAGMSCDCARAFHAAFYAPENVTLVLAGCLDPDAALKAIEHFGLERTFSGGHCSPKAPEVPPIRRECLLVERRPGLQKPYVSVGLIADPIIPERYFAMKSLECALRMLPGSRIKIFGSDLPVSGARLQWQLMKGMSVFTITTYVEPGALKLPEAGAGCAAGLEVAAIGAADLDDIKTAVAREYLMNNYRLRDFAHTVGLFSFLGCPGLASGYRDYLGGISADDIADLALRGFRGCMVSITLPEG